MPADSNLIEGVVSSDARYKRKRRAHGNTTHGGYALALLDGDFDYRTDNGKTVKAFRGVLIHHLGGEQRISGPQMILVDQAVRLQLLARIAWMHSHRNGNFKVGGEATGAFDAYLRVTRALREVLAMLGLKRRQIELTLGDILAEEQRK
jgi:hypothetical protein